MYIVNTSARALLVALLPLAVVHAVLTAMAVLAIQASQPAELRRPTRFWYFT